MCDYSLMELPSRLAKEQEQLQVYHFPTGTKGLAPAGLVRRSFWQQVKDLFTREEATIPCVVCIPPGARLTLHEISPVIQREFGVGPTEEVTFTQLHAHEGYHRDAIRFSNGQTLSLQMLQAGQPVDVICLTLPEEEDSELSYLEQVEQEQWELASTYMNNRTGATRAFL